MMKNFTFFAFLLFCLPSSLFAAAVTWDGGAGTSNWGDAANWSNNAVPTAADDVTLSGTLNIQNVTISTIKSLTISGDIVLTHVAGASAGNLTIAGGGTFTINATYSLELAGTNATTALRLAFGTGTSTSNIYGKLKLTGLGTQYQCSNAVTYVGDATVGNPTGIIEINGGAVFNSTTVALQFRATGVVDLYASSVPVAAYNSASTIKIRDSGVSFPTPTTVATTNISAIGNIEFYGSWGSSAAAIVRMGGATATNNNKWIINGKLTVNAGSGGSVSLGSSASAGTQVNVTVADSIKILSGTLNIARSSATSIGYFYANGVVNIASGATLTLKALSTTGTTNGYIKGTLNNDGTITEDGAANATTSLEFNGTSQQTIGGIFTGKLSVKLNNTSGYVLNSDFQMNGTGANHILNFAAGQVSLGDYNVKVPNPITIGAVGTNYFYTNGTGSLVLKNVAPSSSAFFPIGIDAATYCPATMTTLAGHTADDMKAKVSSTLASGLPPHSDPNKVFPFEWELGEANTGGSQVQVALQAPATSMPSAFSTAGNVAIGHFENTSWVEYPATITQPSGAILITSNAANGITSFSPFAIGQAGALLPIELTYFRAEPKGKQVQLTWQTAFERNTTNFIIERSQDAINFAQIGTIEAAGRSDVAKSYDFIDISAKNGINYYRLREVETDGAVFTSPIVALDLSKKGSAIETAFVDSDRQLNLVVQNIPNDENATMWVSDMSGAVLNQQTLDLNEGINQYQVTLPTLQTGIYIITISLNNQRLTKQILVK